jgi:hypothetical protein
MRNLRSECLCESVYVYAFRGPVTRVAWELMDWVDWIFPRGKRKFSSTLIIKVWNESSDESWSSNACNSHQLSSMFDWGFIYRFTFSIPVKIISYFSCHMVQFFCHYYKKCQIGSDLEWSVEVVSIQKLGNECKITVQILKFSLGHPYLPHGGN